MKGSPPELKDPGRKRESLDPDFERIILDELPVYQSGPVIL
jgi:hypothetical protein